MEESESQNILFLFMVRTPCFTLRVHRGTINLTASINVWMSNFETKISIVGKKYGCMDIIKQLGIQLLSCSLGEVELVQYHGMQL